MYMYKLNKIIIIAKDLKHIIEHQEVNCITLVRALIKKMNSFVSYCCPNKHYPISP